MLDTGTGAASFVSTAWTTVVRAGSSDSVEARRHMGMLIARYWRPVYHFILRYGKSHEDAKDLTQAFFLSFIEKRAVGYAQKDRGRFRSFLLACVKQYLAREHRASSRKPAELQMDFGLAQNEDHFAGQSEDPIRTFTRNWAKCLIENVVGRLRNECDALGKPLQFRAFHLRMLEGTSRAETAAGLGVEPKDVDNLLASARKRFDRLLRDEVRGSVIEEIAVENEITELLSSLQ
jgi:RNA polymerase sigma factor (sigma-70 family)